MDKIMDCSREAWTCISWLRHQSCHCSLAMYHVQHLIAVLCFLVQVAWNQVELGSNIDEESRERLFSGAVQQPSYAILIAALLAPKGTRAQDFTRFTAAASSSCCSSSASHVSPAFACTATAAA
jgi:hypothetical protein